MRPRNSTPTARQVHRCTAAILQDHLQLPDHGPKCRAGPLFTLLFYAAGKAKGSRKTKVPGMNVTRISFNHWPSSAWAPLASAR
jgi:hypothetical protein